ncbi:MAG TPA: undecaprenyl-diphosphate phosphatase [Actinomycetota bacterium]|nr:undecaprenyl-diphosphate phosphatase [Actinomycetota bacterium]
MTWLQGAILGLVQGATEFLPVSSKTHLVVVPALLGWEPPELAFIVLLHLGTFCGLLAYYLKRVLGIVRGVFRGEPRDRRLAVLLVVATIPAAVAGLAFEASFERLLERPAAVAFSLIATAVVLVVAELASGTIGPRDPRPMRQRAGPTDAVAMGLAQCVALLPGVSRSGATMSAGLVNGLSRPAAAEFSFLMSLPAIAGANVLELPEVVAHGLGGAEVAGFLAALVSGYLVVALLLRYLRSRTFLPFALYCLVFGPLAGLALSR